MAIYHILMFTFGFGASSSSSMSNSAKSSSETSASSYSSSSLSLWGVAPTKNPECEPAEALTTSAVVITRDLRIFIL